jgi:hypothetical protein
MWNSIHQLESEKFDFVEHMKHQKYEVLSAKSIESMKERRTKQFDFIVN